MPDNGTVASTTRPDERESKAQSGGCRCGAVTFSCSGAKLVTHCHCSDCRGWTGCAFLTNVAFPLDQFRYTSGEEEVATWVAGPMSRSFCRICGTHLTSRNTQSPLSVVGVPRGLLGDEGSVPDPSCHLHVAEKPSWYELSSEDGVARFEHWPKRPTSP